MTLWFRPTIRMGRNYLVAALLLATAGCATQAPTETGFLGDYTEMKPSAAHPCNPSFRKAGPMAAYDSFIVEEVVYRPASGTDILTPEDEAALKSEYRDRLIAAFSEKYRHTDTNGPGVMRIRAAITDVGEAIPVLNAVTMIAVVVPVTAGGASSEAEVVDSLTGERLAAYQGFNNGGQSFLGGPLGFLEAHGQALRAFTVQAEELRDLLADEDHPCDKES